MDDVAAMLKTYFELFSWTERSINWKLDRKHQGDIQIKNK